MVVHEHSYNTNVMGRTLIPTPLPTPVETTEAPRYCLLFHMNGKAYIYQDRGGKAKQVRDLTTGMLHAFDNVPSEVMQAYSLARAQAERRL